MNKSILISGYGSIGRRHANILSRLVKKKNITILTNQRISNFRTIKTLKALNKIDPHYIIICNPTSDHINKIRFIEKNFKNKLVLIEKPLFSKPNKINLKKNKYYVGYNLRFNPIINFLKKKIRTKKIWNVNIFCGSYIRSPISNIRSYITNDSQCMISQKVRFSKGALGAAKLGEVLASSRCVQTTARFETTRVWR